MVDTQQVEIGGGHDRETKKSRRVQTDQEWVSYVPAST